MLEEDEEDKNIDTIRDSIERALWRIIFRLAIKGPLMLTQNINYELSELEHQLPYSVRAHLEEQIAMQEGDGVSGAQIASEVKTGGDRQGSHSQDGPEPFNSHGDIRQSSERKRRLGDEALAKVGFDILQSLTDAGAPTMRKPNGRPTKVSAITIDLTDSMEESDLFKALDVLSPAYWEGFRQEHAHKVEQATPPLSTESSNDRAGATSNVSVVTRTEMATVEHDNAEMTEQRGTSMSDVEELTTRGHADAFKDISSNNNTSDVQRPPKRLPKRAMSSHQQEKTIPRKRRRLSLSITDLADKNEEKRENNAKCSDAVRLHRHGRCWSQQCVRNGTKLAINTVEEPAESRPLLVPRSRRGVEEPLNNAEALESERLKGAEVNKTYVETANAFVASNETGSDGEDDGEDEGEDDVEDEENSVEDVCTEGEEGVDEEDDFDDIANGYTESIGSGAKEMQDKSSVVVGKGAAEKGDKESVRGKGSDHTGLDVDNVNFEGSVSSTENTHLGKYERAVDEVRL